MQPFAVHEREEGIPPPHVLEAVCPACEAGYPQPCPRIETQSFKATEFDAAGETLETEWIDTLCPGQVHAILGEILETRCSSCGVPP